MKTILIASIFALFSFSSIAQSALSTTLRHQFRIGGGAIFVGTGDMIGATYRNEYEYAASKRFSLAASVNLSNAGREMSFGISEKTFRRVKSFTTIDANALFGLIDTQHFKLKIGGGLSLKREVSNDPSFVGFRSVPPQTDPSGAIIDYRFSQSLRTWSVGWTVPVSVELHFNRWSYQLRPALHSFADGEINTSANLGVGYKF